MKVIENTEEDEEYADDDEEPEEDNNQNTSLADCLEFKFGCETDRDPIVVYVVPSCLHCVTFLVEDLDKFLKEYGQLHGVVVRFIIPTKKDIFIIKLFYNEFLSQDWENKAKEYQTNKYKMYWQYVDYVKRVIATSKSSEDPDLEEFKKIAIDFKFNKEDVKKAEPNPEGNFEKEIVAKSADYTGNVARISKSEEISTPYITKEGKELKSLVDAAKMGP
jgi:hypothetical protein